MKITQIVAYTPNPKNPLAAYMIISEAKRILGSIPHTVLRVGNAIQSDRAVAVSNGMVIKMTTWPNQACKDLYFTHPRIREWCRFVLKGWMLKNSMDADPLEELIDHILSGTNRAVGWVRDPLVPEDEVVWAGETVTLFEHEDDHPC